VENHSHYKKSASFPIAIGMQKGKNKKIVNLKDVSIEIDAN